MMQIDNSLTNHILGNSKQKVLIVGMGATVIMFSDRKACTILATTKTTVTVQYDKATRTDHNGMSDSQTYSYEENPEGQIKIFRMTKKGWNHHGDRLRVGSRDHYHDFSF